MVGRATDLSRLEVMNFLNEAAIEHPHAISLASGRPAEAFFDLDSWLGQLPRQVERLASAQGQDPLEVQRQLAQYGRTSGLIQELVAEQLRADEGILCQPQQMVITAGCQEAIALCVRALCSSPGDLLAVRSPTYIGATGAADLFGVELAAVDSRDPSQLVEAFAKVVDEAIACGRRVRAFYLIPDFDNPTGDTLSLPTRERLLALCAERRIVLLEDNPYGLFRYEGQRLPPMSALDRAGSVLYLGTYSKTLCPSLRTGFVVVPPALFGEASAARALCARLSQLKSFLTVNTSQVLQAVVGGVLLSEGGSLSGRLRPALDHYRRNRDEMLGCLERVFGPHRDRARWNHPEGGFFLTVELPIPFGREEAQACAIEHGVLVLPLSFFSLTGSHDRSVRLAFSSVERAAIGPAIERLGAFVERRLAGRRA